jgi:hypothetical protein
MVYLKTQKNYIQNNNMDIPLNTSYLENIRTLTHNFNPPNVVNMVT